MNRLSIIEYKKKLFQHLNKLRVNGLFYASPSIDYNATWWRDNMFINLAYLKNNPPMFKETINKSLDTLENMEKKYNKLSSMVNHPDEQNWRHLHAKFNPITLDEIPNLGDNWSHKQYDALGLILLNICYAYETCGINDKYKNIIQLLVDYTTTVSFKPDSGSWEENIELRTSSIALVVKALKKIKKYGYVVNEEDILKGEQIINKILPYETNTRNIDLTLLYLPFFNITDDIDTQSILKRYERDLIANREYGCRYLEDKYYSNENGEAEWCFSRAFISVIYKKLGFNDVAGYQIEKAMRDFPDGRIPELVYAGTLQPNINTPLAWSLAMYIVAIDIYLENDYSILNLLE